MRIRVVVTVVTKNNASLLQVFNDERVRFKDVNTCPVGNLRRVTTVAVHWANRFDSGGEASDLVIFTKARGHVHDTSSIFGRHKFGTENLEGRRRVREVIKERRIGAPNEL